MFLCQLPSRAYEKMKIRIRKNNKGIALIVTVGVLAMMLIIGTSFTINMMADHRSSVNMAMAAQARAAAEAGLNIAIVSARNLAVSDFNGVPAATMSGSLGNVGRGNTAAYSVNITDTTSQLNVNDTNPGLEDMLESLVAILGSPLQAGDGTAIISYRSTLTGGVYITKEQVTDAFSGTTSVKQAKFNKIAEYVTVNGYIDENSEDSTASSFTGLDNPNSTYQRKAPVNINKADAKVLRAVLAPVITPTDPATLAGDIITRRNTNFFTSWNDFDGFIDGLGYLTAAEKIKIKNNANPNKVKVDSVGVPLSYTTDFCFHPGGVYEITSTGTAGPAQKRITALVRIYDVINYTTKEQFRGDTYTVIPAVYDGTLPIFKNVNWLNSCPVTSDYDNGLEVDPPNYSTNAIANSLKLGFWDNFDEDNDNVSKTGWSWRNWQDSSPDGHDIVITDVNPVYPNPPGAHGPQPNLTDGDNELSDDASYGPTALAYLDLRGTQSGQWNCNQEFSLRVYCNVLKNPPPQAGYPLANNYYDSNDRWEGYEDTEQIDFVPAGQTGQIYISNFRCVYFGDYGSRAIIDGIGYDVPGDFIDSMLRLNFYGGGGDHYMYLNKDMDGNYMYSSIGDVSPLHTLVPADANRIVPINATFRLIVHGAADNNYQIYLAVSPTGIAYHEWPDSTNAQAGICEADGGAWIPWLWQIHYLIYNAVDKNYHQFVDTGADDRYGYMESQFWHDQTANRFIYTDWYLRLINHPSTIYGRYALFDEVRLIPDQGYYISPASTTASNGRFGTASWTLAIPPGAVTNERAAVEISRDGGASFSPVNINGGANIDPSTTMCFKVTLLSDDPQHLQTPVLEDITLTRLPKVAVLYCKYE